jgi:hypothetical protein
MTRIVIRVAIGLLAVTSVSTVVVAQDMGGSDGPSVASK